MNIVIGLSIQSGLLLCMIAHAASGNIAQVVSCGILALLMDRTLDRMRGAR